MDVFAERGRIRIAGGREIKYRIAYGKKPGIVSVPAFDGCDRFLEEKCKTENRSFFSFTPSETKLDQVRSREVVVGWDFGRLIEDTAHFFHALIRQRAEGPQVVVASSLGARAALEGVGEAGKSAAQVVLLSPEVYLRQILKPAFHPTWGVHRFFRDNGYFDHTPSSSALFGSAATPLVRVTKEHAKAMRDAEASVLAVPCPVAICRTANGAAVQREASEKLLDKISAPEKEMKDIKNTRSGPKRPGGSISEAVWAYMQNALLACDPA